MDNYVYVSETIASFIDFIEDSRDAYQECIREIGAADNETQDLLHFIELEKLDAVKMTQVCKRLKDARIRRRRAKDTVELLEPLIRWYDKCGTALNPLQKKTLPAVQAVEINQRAREYYVRTDILKDLTSKGRL